MIRNQPHIKRLFLFMDVLLFCIAFSFAFYLSLRRQEFQADHKFFHVIYTTTLAGGGLFIYVVTFFLNNLYKRHILLSRYRQFILILKSELIACSLVLLLAAVIYHSELVLFGRIFIGVLFLTSFLLSVFFRIVVCAPIARSLYKNKLFQQRLLVVGGDKAGQYVASSLQNDSYCNFTLVGFVDDYKELGEEISIGENTNNHFHNLGCLDDLPTIIKEYQVDEILIAIDNTPYQRLIQIVETCIGASPTVRIYSDFLNVVAKKLRVELYSGIPVIMLSQNPLDSLSWKAKRLLDIILSVGAIIVLSPLLVLIALGIKMSSPGPIFFKQTRIGRQGVPFDFYKFRSMHVGNDSGSHKEFVQNYIKGTTEKECESVRVFKITNDPRIFKFGSFIRKTSLDEFPQFLNVLKGDMTLVGPRPCLPYEWDCYDEWHKERLNVLPGCTGMWQALGRSNVSFEEMVILDLYYISNMTLLLDLKVALLTVPVVFFAKGGY